MSRERRAQLLVASDIDSALDMLDRAVAGASVGPVW